MEVRIKNWNCPFRCLKMKRVSGSDYSRKGLWTQRETALMTQERKATDV